MKKIVFILFVINSLATYSQHCHIEVKSQTEFDYVTQFSQFETGWYEEWLQENDKVLPSPLPAQEKWNHPYMKFGYTSAMHEDSHSTDVSNLSGPTPENVSVQYFHVLQKSKSFSGMCPAFDFVNDSTLVTLSFGRENTTLLLLDAGDTLHVLDKMG